MRSFGCLFAFAFLALLVSVGLAAWVVSLVLGLTFGSSADPSLGVALAVAGVLTVVLAIGTFSGRVRRIGGPLDELTDAAARVAGGDLTARVSEVRRGPAELSALVASFNTMAARLELDEEQRRTLLADVSHELRTPLSVIVGNIEAMIDGVYPADAGHLAAVLDEARVMERLVEDLRTVALAEAGTLALHRESVDIDVLIADAVGAFGAAAASTGVSLVVDVPSDLPLIDVDPVRIREVLSNLVSNALSHTPAGGSVRVEARANDDPRSVVVVVKDTGAGIAPELLPRMFVRFVRGDGSRGSGLGLAIAKDLVEAHGGTISAQSEPGRGATFRVTLPLR